MNVDWSEAGVALTAFLAWTGMTGWVWSVREIAVGARDDLHDLKAERERDKVSWGRRLEKAEETAGEIKVLAEGVKNLGATFEREMRALSQQRDQSQEFTRQQFADIKRELEHLRGRDAIARASRRRGAERDG